MSLLCNNKSYVFFIYPFPLLCLVIATFSLQNSVTFPICAYENLNCSSEPYSRMIFYMVPSLMTLAISHIYCNSIYYQKHFLPQKMSHILNIFVSSTVLISKHMNVLYKNMLDKKVNKLLHARSANFKSTSLAFHHLLSLQYNSDDCRLLIFNYNSQHCVWNFMASSTQSWGNV